jgi:hypothetical protein
MEQVPNNGLQNPASMDEHMRTGLWIALVASSTVLASLVFACATPLSAVATLAGTRMRVTAGCMLVGVAWLANQLVGYLLLGYPQTWDSFGWGAAIGIAAWLGFWGAAAVYRAGLRDPAMTAIGFAVSFLTYEATLFAATAVLPSSDQAFSLRVIARILEVNGVALIGLLVLHRCALALTLGLGLLGLLDRFAVSETSDEGTRWLLRVPGVWSRRVMKGRAASTITRRPLARGTSQSQRGLAALPKGEAQGDILRNLRVTNGSLPS